MQQHDRLAQVAGARGDAEKPLRIADLLGKGRDHLRGRILDQMGDIVFKPQHGFVASRNPAGDRNALGPQGDAHHAGKPAALRDHDDAGLDVEWVAQLRREGQGYAMDEIDDAEAVGAAECNAGLFAQLGDAVLRRFPFAACLAEAGGEDDDRADLAPRTGFDGVLDRDPRNEQHRRVDAFGQIVDRFNADAAADLATIAADQMDRARIGILLEIAQHQKPCRALLGRDADDRDRARPHQPCDVDACHGRTRSRANYFLSRRIGPRPGR